MTHTEAPCTLTHLILHALVMSVRFVGLDLIFFLVVRFISVGILHRLSSDGFSVSMDVVL